jgi:hypothetical protein
MRLRLLQADVRTDFISWPFGHRKDAFDIVGFLLPKDPLQKII